MAEKLHWYKPGRISGSEKVLPEELPSREKLFKIPIAFSRVPIHTLDRRMGVVVHILPTIAKTLANSPHNFAQGADGFSRAEEWAYLLYIVDRGN